MKAGKYLESIGLGNVIDEEFFNDDDKSWYKVQELMEAYHKAKLDLLTIPVVGSSNNFKKTLVSKDVGTFFLTDKEVEVWEKNGNIKTGDILYRTVTDTLY